MCPQRATKCGATPHSVIFNQKRTSAKLSWTQHNNRDNRDNRTGCACMCVPERLSNWFQLTLATAPTQSQLHIEAHSYKYFTFLRLRDRTLPGKSSLWRRPFLQHYTNPIPKDTYGMCVCAGISHAHFVVIRNANWQSQPPPPAAAAPASPGCSCSPVESLAQYMINIP